MSESEIPLINSIDVERFALNRRIYNKKSTDKIFLVQKL